MRAPLYSHTLTLTRKLFRKPWQATKGLRMQTGQPLAELDREETPTIAERLSRVPPSFFPASYVTIN